MSVVLHRRLFFRGLGTVCLFGAMSLSGAAQANRIDIQSRTATERIEVDEPDVYEVVEDSASIDLTEDPAQVDEEFIIIDDGDDSPSSTWNGSYSTFEPSGRFRGEYRSRALWDLRHDGDAEDVFEWWQQLNFLLKYRFSDDFDIVTEIDNRYGVVGEAPQENPFWGLNVSYAKWLTDIDLRQGYLRWRSNGWEISAGSRIFVWGKNELNAPADFMNPLDATGDIVGLLSDPRMAKVPVWALDIGYQWGDHFIQFVAQPIFVRTQVPIVGRDLALAPPGTQLESQIRTAASIHPSIEDSLGDGLVGTEVPEEAIWNSSFAFRGTTTFQGWDFALTGGWVWDRNPTLYIDRDLRGLLSSGVNLLGANAGGNLDPEATAQLAAVQQKAALGQELFRATFRRQFVVAFEGEGVVGPLVVRWDIGWKDGELLYTESLDSFRLQQLSGTLGVEYSYGETFFIQTSAFAQAAFDAPGQPLLGWDAQNSDPGAAGRTATNLGGSIVMRGSPEESDWDWSTRTVVLIQPIATAHVVDIGFAGFENQRVSLGGLVVVGEAASLADDFKRLSLGFVSYSCAF